MEWLAADGYWLSRLVFQRALAVVYLVAFLNAANQFRALLGERGLLPIPAYLARTPFRQSPSLFHLHYSDRFFAVLAWVGVAVSAALVLGLADDLPLPGHMAIWTLLWLIYVSILNVGQLWYAFGWESLLCEVGLLAIFLGPADVPPPLLILLGLRWVVFRLEFGAGLIKLRGDRCWRDMTCLYYHHETQPMPNALSWYFHRLPKPLHRVEAAANHVTQLVVPFLLFVPQPVAGAAALVIIITQGWLVLSGNFSWLNTLTIVIALPVLGDGLLGTVLPVEAPAERQIQPAWFQAVVIAVSSLIVVLSYWPVQNLLSPDQRMNYSFTPLHLVNSYGAFGSITRTRYEVVIQGTTERSLVGETEWREYEFKGKPTNVRRRPPQIAPYHLRLDWLMWFAALSRGYAEPWMERLLAKLLENDRSTLRLLRRNPFPDEPPEYVRAVLYRYRFTTRQERRETGAWWHRSLVGEYQPPMNATHQATR
ncbi:MAG TPA: lipase maturation factor family protein [Jiangellaceae bacterium]|nr:lipase maturation factor family protein [Jiangellaceae bacterium]